MALLPDAFQSRCLLRDAAPTGGAQGGESLLKVRLSDRAALVLPVDPLQWGDDGQQIIVAPATH